MHRRRSPPLWPVGSPEPQRPPLWPVGSPEPQSPPLWPVGSPDSQPAGFEDEDSYRRKMYTDCKPQVYQSTKYAYHDQRNARAMPPLVMSASRRPPSSKPFVKPPKQPKADEDEIIENHPDDDDSELDDDDKIIAEEKAYQSYLPIVVGKVKEVLGSDKPNLLLDKEDRTCEVCPTIQRFKGWKALLSHAEKFKKKRAYQHRGFFRALKEVLRADEKKRLDDSKGQDARLVLMDPSAQDEILVWPAVVIVRYKQVLEEKLQSWKGPESEEIQSYLPGFNELKVDKVLKVAGNSSHHGRSLVVFPASDVGYEDAKALAERLANLHRGRIEWMKYSDSIRSKGATSSDVSRSDVREPNTWELRDKKQFQVYGYMAEPNDMKEMDPDCQLVDWCEGSKIEMIKLAVRKSKQGADEDKAIVKATMVEVDWMGEECAQYEMDAKHLKYQYEQKEKLRRDQDLKRKEMEQLHAQEVEEMDRKFQETMEQLDVKYAEQERNVRRRVEANLRQLKQESKERLKALEVLQEQFQECTDTIKKEEVQEAARKEREILERKQRVNEEIQEKEAQFNEDCRKLERQLTDEHSKQRVKMLEEYEEEHNKILKEWVETQENLKKKAEEAKKEKERLEAAPDKPECAICFTEFIAKEVDRALIHPCGHASLCLDCASACWKKDRHCPVCRTKMSNKPKLCPQKLYF